MTSQPRLPSRQDLLPLFTERLDAVGGHVAQAETIDDLARIVGQIADEDGIDPGTTIWISRPLRNAVPEIAQAVIASGHTVGIPDDPAVVRDQPLGIAIARAAIAETGSVVLVEPDVADRAVTLMTQTLLIICPITALLPSLDEAASILRDLTSDEASYMTFVTGPSRTADIERELTVGVQGPGKLHVVFVSNLS